MKVVHVTPINDLREHEESQECWCNPLVQKESGGIVVIHKSADGRELLEQLDPLLQDKATGAFIWSAIDVWNNGQSCEDEAIKIASLWLKKRCSYYAQSPSVATAVTGAIADFIELFVKGADLTEKDAPPNAFDDHRRVIADLILKSPDNENLVICSKLETLRPGLFAFLVGQDSHDGDRYKVTVHIEEV